VTRQELLNYASGTENARLINERRRDERADEFGPVDGETTTRVVLSNQRRNVFVRMRATEKERKRERKNERDIVTLERIPRGCIVARDKQP